MNINFEVAKVLFFLSEKLFCKACKQAGNLVEELAT